MRYLEAAVICIALQFIASSCAPTVTPRPEVDVTPTVPAPLYLPTLMSRVDSSISRVEAQIERINRTRTIDDDGSEIDRELDTISENAREAFSLVMTEIQRFNDTRGREGDLELAMQFEERVNPFMQRTKAVSAALSSIDGSIRTGEIRLSRRIIEIMSAAERDEFRRTLTPAADSMYQREMPDLLRGAVRNMNDDEWARAATECWSTWGTSADPASHDGTGGVFRFASWGSAEVESAEVAMGSAFICYGICKASLGTACANCVFAAGTAAVLAYQTLQRCLSSCGSCSRWRPWRCACRTLCVTSFLLWLA
jgi:hypothetical protein